MRMGGWQTRNSEPETRAWEDAAAVMAEIAATVPTYAGISYPRLAVGETLQWPCPSPGHPGTPILYADGFPGGGPRFLPFAYRPLEAPPDADYPLLLAAGRDLLAYHKEVLTAQSDATTRPYDHALRVHPDDALRYGVVDGEPVRIGTRGSALAVKAQVTGEVPPGALYLTLPILEDTDPLQGGPVSELLDQLPRSPLLAARIERDGGA